MHHYLQVLLSQIKLLDPMSSNQKSDSTENKEEAQYIPGDHTCHVYYVLLNTTNIQTASSTPWIRPQGLD
jgi:hypothetical protein